MISSEITNQYLSARKSLTLLSGKTPILDDWTENLPDRERVLSYRGNLGWVLGETDLVIDVDPKNGGFESLKKLQIYLSENEPDMELIPTVVTPSGGYHYYLKIPSIYLGRSFRKTLKKEYPGIDFLTKGAQCVIVGGKTSKGIYEWYDDLIGGFYQESCPSCIIELISKEKRVKGQELANTDLGDFDDLIGGESSNWPEVKVIELLDRLDPSMPNDEWVKVGMALHDWDPIRGLFLWEDWSKAGDNYTPGDTEARWRSFDLGGGVTLGTVTYMVREVDYDEKSQLVKQYIERIKKASEKTIEFDIAPEISKQEIDSIGLEKIAHAIQSKLKGITDIKIPIGTIRKMISPKKVTGELVDEMETPEWCKQWIYVNSHTGFIDLDTLKLHKSESFNIECGKYVPMGENGSKPSATKYIADRGFIRKADTVAYLPSIEKLICKIDGLKVLNSFNPRTVPMASEKYSEDGLLAIDLIKKHIKLICGNDTNAHIFTQWLAHQVQFPGKKILWAPVIQSIQGTGKSFFGELLRCCLGDRNVGTVSPTQVTSDFNGWSTNVVVNVLEELRVKGHNRYDAVNALKPLITDRMIQINEKGVKQFMAYNTTNYLCFTNYKDSIPMVADDRRWWIVFVDLETLDDIEKRTGDPYELYFPRLFESLQRSPSDVRKWLLEYEISDEFKNTKQAPMTNHKLSMIATEEANVEGLSEVREVIEQGGKYWGPTCVSSTPLFESVAFEHPDLELNNSQKNMIMKRLGFSMLPNKIKIDKVAHKIWSKKPMKNDEVRSLFETYNSNGDYDVDDL